MAFRSTIDDFDGARSRQALHRGVVHQVIPADFPCNDSGFSCRLFREVIAVLLRWGRPRCGGC